MSKYMHLGERNTHYAQFYIIKTIASTIMSAEINYQMDQY